jgi:ATP-dependent exoDNAse (exonuclease V) alpha subunit
MLSVPQIVWRVNHASENVSRVLLVGDSAQHRSVERGDALRILEQSGAVRYVELLHTQRQKEPGLKAAIEDLKAGRLQAAWEKLEQHGVFKEVPDDVRSIRWLCCWMAYVSLSRARDSMHVNTRDKAALRQSVMYPGERNQCGSLSKLCEVQSRNPEIE